MVKNPPASAGDTGDMGSIPRLGRPSGAGISWQSLFMGKLTNKFGLETHGSSDGRESACHAGDLGSIHGSGRCPGKGNGNLLQYSCLENPLDRGAWRATVHGSLRVEQD